MLTVWAGRGGRGCLGGAGEEWEGTGKEVSGGDDAGLEGDEREEGKGMEEEGKGDSQRIKMKGKEKMAQEPMKRGGKGREGMKNEGKRVWG